MILPTLLLALCASSTQSVPTPRDLPVPTEWHSSSAPRFVARPGRPALLSFVEESEGRARLRWAELGKDGWGAPTTIAEGTDWLVNWADVPAVAAGPGNAMVATWLVRSGEDGHGYGVALSTSPDGKHWSEPRSLHDSLAGPEHGFVSLVFHASDTGDDGDAEPAFDALWLDSRAMAKGHGTPGAGAMALLARRISVGAQGPELGPERVLDERTCDCCATTALRGASGDLLVAYRDRTRDEVRDIAVLRLDSGGETSPLDPRADRWTIAGCPVNGPDLARRGETLGLAWFTMDRGLTGTARPKPIVRAAFGTEAGGFESPRRLDLGAPVGRVAAAFDGAGHLRVAWLEDGSRSADGTRTPARWLLADLGTREAPAAPTGASEPRTLAEADPTRRSGFPDLFYDAASDRLLFAFTAVREDGSTFVRTLSVR